ncbi:MAG: hypothetical protein NT157_05005 [Candidatus Micrarchaeota archaeon]|nr:hypothetical protein [Candidatus Micrarchaeota archaeon]
MNSVKTALATGVAVAGLAMNALAADGAPAGADKPAGPTLGLYPNFSNFGVHPNPASFFGQPDRIYFEWSKVKEAESTELFWSSSRNGVTACFFLKNTSDGGKNSYLTRVNISFPVCDHLIVGTRLSNGQGRVDGLMGTFDWAESRLNAGVQYDGKTGRIAAELRKRVHGAEVTASVAVAVDRALKDMTDKGVGVQLKKGKNLVSFGKGGPDWHDMKFHYRRYVNPKTLVDLHVSGNGKNVLNVLKKPGYVGVGFTKVF